MAKDNTHSTMLAWFQLLSVKLFVEKMARALLSKCDFFFVRREDISNSVSPVLKLLQYLVGTAKHLYKHFSWYTFNKTCDSLCVCEDFFSFKCECLYECVIICVCECGKSVILIMVCSWKCVRDYLRLESFWPTSL